MMPRALLAIGLVATLLGGCHASRIYSGNEPQAMPSGWSVEELPGAQPGVIVKALTRSALVQPVRYRVVVVPGSGCTGWKPLAPRYFSGLLHAELLVLSKPGVDINAGMVTDCTPEFVQSDALSTWRDHAKAALRVYESRKEKPEPLPQLLVGISEGAELLPDLAPELSSLAGVVMVSTSGLDPREVGELQARRLGQLPAWRALENAQSSNASDGEVIQGRTLKYWRDFWKWPLAQRLFDAPWPLLRVWGDADLQSPVTAYHRFAEKSLFRSAPFCDLRLPGADHGLQANDRDGVQWLWGRLENWARSPDVWNCER